MPEASMTTPTGTAEPELYVSGRAKARASRNRRYLAYLVGVAALAGIIAFADWDAIRTSFFDWSIAKEQFPGIVTTGARNTIVYTVLSFSGGVILGVTMALLRLSSIRPYRWFAAVYVEIFRGLPALLTIFLVGFMVPIALGIGFPVILGVDTAGIVALSLVAGAYLAETIRAGIEAVPPGQVEAARSLGMSGSQTLRNIVVPQAFRIVIPPLTNEMVLLLKDTALLSVLGFAVTQRELLKYSRDGVGENFNGTPFIVAGVLYLVITIPLTRLVARLENKNRSRR